MSVIDAHYYVLHLPGSQLDGEPVCISGTHHTRETADAAAEGHAAAIDATVVFVGTMSDHNSPRCRTFYPAIEVELLPWWARDWLADQELRAGKLLRKARAGTAEALHAAYGPVGKGRRARRSA